MSYQTKVSRLATAVIAAALLALTACSPDTGAVAPSPAPMATAGPTSDSEQLPEVSVSPLPPATIPSKSAPLPSPNPSRTVTTVDGHAAKPIGTKPYQRSRGANAGPEASGGANAAPQTRSYTIYDTSEEAEQSFRDWWNYEALIPTAQNKPFEAVYTDGVTVCSYRAMGYQPETLWRYYADYKGYAGTDAAALVAAAFRGLCPTDVELSTTAYSLNGWKTAFDKQVDSAYFQFQYSPNITNQVGMPKLFDVAYFMKHTCHGIRMYGNTPNMLLYLRANVEGPYGSTYLPALASNDTLIAMTRLAATAGSCMSVIGG